MKLRISLQARYLTLLGTLGLVPLACDSTLESEFSCTDSSPEVVQGQDSGYEICAEGQRHRPAAVQCASSLPRADVCESSDPMFPGNCSSDADCTEKPHGQCGIFGQIAECGCSYGCVTDADCAAGQICDCGDPVGRCVAADCATDADCTDDLLCVAFISDPGCGGTAFTCQSELDECASDEDCSNGDNCTKGEAGFLVCQGQQCAIGRPFLIDGDHRTAETAPRGDWRVCDVAPLVSGLSPDMRNALADHWTEIALMEHASIAAFARFALQLLAAGAPPQLLIETQDAMRDETRHATIAFALASAYAGHEIGPGPLSIDGALNEDDPRDILRMVIREGCIGETVAAIEAAEAAEHATDPVVQAVLQQIASDEQRHADLAWRYVAWVINQDPRLARTLLSEINATTLEQADRQTVADMDRRLLTHGVVTDAVRSGIRQRVLREIIAPTAMALTEQRAAA